MQAIVNRTYGSADVLALEQVEEPVPGADQVLVRVRAAGVNPYDYHGMNGRPLFGRLTSGLRAPKEIVRGVDAAGIVEAVGSGVTDLAPGDEVFGARNGAFAELVAGKSFVRKPTRLTFEQAAAIPIAGVTALQGLDKGGSLAGRRVLVNGASGGVGTFAVQIAKARGAHVTGVCSTRNVELVRSLGADEVIDYTKEDFTRTGPYDLVLDNVGNRSLRARRRAVAPDGIFVVAGGLSKHLTLSLLRSLTGVLLSRFGRKKMTLLLANMNKEALGELRDLVETGELTPVVDRTYPFADAAEAIRYVQTERARGKVVLTM